MSGLMRLVMKGCLARRSLIFGSFILALAAAPATAAPILVQESGTTSAAPIIPTVVFDLATLLGDTPLDSSAMPEGDDIAPPSATRGETLERVLRSVVTLHAIEDQSQRANKGKDPAAGRPTRADDELDDAYRAAYRMLLENEALGNAMRWVVQTHESKDGSKTFSLFGRGVFELELADDGKELRLKELTSGISLPISERETDTVREGGSAAPGRDDRANDTAENATAQHEMNLKVLRLITKVFAFVRSVEGQIVLLLCLTLAVLVGAVRAGLRISKRRTTAFEAVAKTPDEAKRPVPHGITAGTARRA